MDFCEGPKKSLATQLKEDYVAHDNFVPKKRFAKKDSPIITPAFVR
jgi:hypothetical protein